MEKKETNTLSIFQRPVWVSLFALTAAISWGWAYPLIKWEWRNIRLQQT